MPLSPGNKLAPNEIIVPIGKDGIGQVHRGGDTEVDREVAVKVLPSTLRHDPEQFA